MNDHEPFEKRLQRQPLRKVPSAWREEILVAARKAEPLRHPSAATRQSFFSALNAQLSTLLWPHPRAWAGLAAAWVLICALNFAYRDDSTSTALHRAAPPSLQMREMLREQDQLLAELVGETPVTDRLKSVPPRPHSLYRNEFLNA